MPRPPVDIPEINLHRKDRRGIVEAIHNLSLIPVHRGFRDVKTKSAAYTMDPIFDRIILATGTTTITLPPADDADHVVYNIVRTGAATISVTTGGGTIDGVDVISTPATITTQYKSISVASDGTNYFRVDNNS